MAGKTPARASSWQDKMPPSPLGATPRPHLRQQYPKPPEGSYVSEFELNRSLQSDQSKVKRSSTKCSYTILRSHQNSLDKVDAPQPVDYSPLPEDYPPSPVKGGSCTKSVIVIALIFFLSLLAVALVFLSRNPKLKE